MRCDRPPTRVSNACDRCRRQKQRCDQDRPCSNCQHAHVECTASDRAASFKKPRFSKRPELQVAITASQRLTPRVESYGNVNGDGEDQSSHYDPFMARPGSVDPLSRDAPSASTEQPEQRSEQSVLGELRGAETAVHITKKFLRHGSSQATGSRETFAIPGGDLNRPTNSTPTYGKLLPIAEVLGRGIPSRDVCDALVDTYFYTVHWFSLVVYEPTFRARYNAIMDRDSAFPSDRPFLLLLSMILVMGCWYGQGILSAEILSMIDLGDTRRALLRIVSQNFMDLIDEDCLEFVQLSVLLGSYWLYWGRPRSSFSILGAATKSAQAMELHRNSDSRRSTQNVEERKRVWWTIYTWDRFATIIYGRPLGINDKDCNVSMPASFSENISFSPQTSPSQVCLSTYQIHLNQIYRLTSPLLENIYGIRYSHDRSLRSQMPTMVAKIDQLMQAWQEDLPPHLHLDKNDDITLASSIEEKMHCLQALSLQLTYDNLMVVIHRPLLADQGYRRSRTQFPPPSNPSGLHASLVQDQQKYGTNDNSFRQCLNSALRISQVQQSKRNLLALARSTHLVSFLGMNLFTSSVVLFICALSDTLSDIAQEAKRGMARNLKLLKLLSGDGSLSMQCSVILEDLVQQIVDKERDEMLRAVPTDDEMAAFLPSRRNSYLVGHSGNNGTETDSEAPEQMIGMHRQLQDNLNDNAVANGGFAVHRAMASLQGVFKDKAAPRSQPSSSLFNTDRYNQEQFYHNQSQQIAHGDTRGEYPGFNFDGSDFNTDDLGQFWLWNMDPYADESVASWQSGDDHIQ